jgi:hypothetical protein
MRCKGKSQGLEIFNTENTEKCEGVWRIIEARKIAKGGVV